MVDCGSVNQENTCSHPQRKREGRAKFAQQTIITYSSTKGCYVLDSAETPLTSAEGRSEDGRSMGWVRGGRVKANDRAIEVSTSFVSGRDQTYVWKAAWSITKPLSRFCPMPGFANNLAEFPNSAGRLYFHCSIALSSSRYSLCHDSTSDKDVISTGFFRNL